MSFHATIITLYPDMFPGPLGTSLSGKGMEKGLWSLETINLRDFGHGVHKAVDDTPAGGGAGMVLRADVLADALDHSIKQDDTRPRLLMSPRGTPLKQDHVRQQSQSDGLIIVCGRFEGVDERVIEEYQLQEISVGDYILSGGEIAALTMLDAIVRLIPGVMGNASSGTYESFETGLLEHPHYTRPKEWRGRSIPDVLSSGNHKEIEKWRKAQALDLTAKRRPDLLKKT
jgi:tRNA (guanine37-N1)-methyltransferase